jgi:uncharacterized protein YidB (DUF937 family)
MVMGLLDSVIGAVAGGMGGQGRGGTQGVLLNAVIAMLANRQGQGGAGGGLGDLIGKFTQGAPISGDQLASVLGSDTISDLAAQLGLSHEEAAGQLSQVLPQVVDRLTPQGHAPAGGLGGMDDLLAQLSSLSQGR